MRTSAVAVAVGCAAGNRAKRPSVYLGHTTGEDIHLKRTGVHYALLPVWMLNTRWNGKNYMFAMNGQTGRMVGDPAGGQKTVLGSVCRRCRAHDCGADGAAVFYVRRRRR